MKVSKVGLDIIKKYEGLRLEAYKCPAGVWTIGYGHTKGVKKGDVISEKEASNLLTEDVSRAEKAVDKYHGVYNWNQNEYDALVSFAFNLGNIVQLTASGERDREGIARAIPLYVNAGGKKLEGLVKRRQEELGLFLTPANDIVTYPALCDPNLTLDELIITIGADDALDPNVNLPMWKRRKPLALRNGIVNYVGSAQQNLQLRTLIAEGNLR